MRSVPPDSNKPPVVALAGNPNAGKTSLFNALTGQAQHVGNYPGVTVDKTSGRTRVDDRTLEVVDLPGTYSLTAYSIEEIVTRDFVLEEKPDIVIDVVDSTNLERNLYLLLQFQELGVPVVGALNMADEAERKGIHIDVDQLSKLLGIPLFKTVASRGVGTQELMRAVLDVIDQRVDTSERHLNYGPELEDRHEELMEVLRTDSAFAERYSLHWMAIKLLEEDSDAQKKVRKEHAHADLVLEAAAKAVEWVCKHFGQDAEVVVGEQRYAYIRGALKEAVRVDPQPEGKRDATDLIDSVVLNRYLGVPIFFLVMLAIYALTFLLGNPLADQVETGIGLLGALASHVLPEGILQDFVVNGVIAGVGGVLVFFPIVMLLFLGLSFLEDVGYMARAAFVMDKFLHLFGLHGRSFIPLMVSTGCAVPGVMSARTLVSPKDRTLTVLISPLMMCGAKTPVVAMLCAAFFPRHAAIVFWCIWLFGWGLAFAIAFVFRKTLFRGEDSPFVMELPPYRMPTLRGVASHMWHRSWSYVKKAGTFILAASVIIWVLLTFPRPDHLQPEFDARVVTVKHEANDALANPHLPADVRTRLKNERDEAITAIRAEERMQEAAYSIAGRAGRLLEPVMQPAGFDWKINVALFSGVAAKEVIISTMGIVYGIGEADADAESDELRATPLKDRLRNDPSYSPLSVLALMVFVMVYVPCIATLAVTRKELGSIKWPAFMAGFTLIVAYVLAVAVYQVGRLFV
ncbi:MAG: ferrous iron transport protein B [Myxococcota bacterium]